MGKLVRKWQAQLGLAALAIGVVLAAPLASPNKAAADPVIISGARSLSDQVVVNFAKKQGRTTDVHVLAFNDLHGTLNPAGNNLYGRFAGGAAFLSKMLKDRQAAYQNEITVFAGDNIGASPLENGFFHEEPITIASNLMNVDFASVGNHEFDKGAAELLRIQNGGCHPDGCTGPSGGAPYALPGGGTTDVYPGADFQYLSTNVVRTATGETLFPAYATKRFKSDSGKKITIGFLGEVLESTPTIVTPTGVAGLTFQDEADAANNVLSKVKTVGNAEDSPDTWVLVIHEGGFQSGAAVLNGCAGNLAGSAIEDIAKRLDPRVKVIISAHTHAEYRCTITTTSSSGETVTRLITSASSFGRILSDVTLTIDDKTGQLVAAAATNTIVDNALNASGPGVIRQPDPSKADSEVQAVVDQYVTKAAPLANRVIGRAAGDLTRTGSRTAPAPGGKVLGESTLGDVIADGQLAATQPANLGGAVIAFMNPGGIRGDLLRTTQTGGEAVGEVTYGEAFTIQPFGNSLVTKTMSGDMLRRLLQQQYRAGPAGGSGPPCNGSTAPAGGRVLQISWTFKYEVDSDAANCADKIGQMWVRGGTEAAPGPFVVIQPTDSFRVTMNNFLATGGDGFTVFSEGTNALGGAQDIDAWVAYFQAKEPGGITVPALDRIVPKP
ncbi:MAG: bifunctional metallophosphatase/5'-nucleotidase [Gaiellaceae bacterium]